MGWTKAGDWVTTEAMTDPRDILRLNWIQGFMTLDVGCESERRFKTTYLLRADHLTKMETRQGGINHEWTKNGKQKKESNSWYFSFKVPESTQSWYVQLATEMKLWILGES